MKCFRSCDSIEQEQKSTFIPSFHTDNKLPEKLFQEHKGELKQGNETNTPCGQDLHRTLALFCVTFEWQCDNPCTTRGDFSAA